MLPDPTPVEGFLWFVHMYSESDTCASFTVITSVMVAYTHTNSCACLNNSGLSLLARTPNSPLPAPGSLEVPMAKPSFVPYGCLLSAGRAYTSSSQRLRFCEETALRGALDGHHQLNISRGPFGRQCYVCLGREREVFILLVTHNVRSICAVCWSELPCHLRLPPCEAPVRDSYSRVAPLS
jgi:hypothetical protein